MAGESARPQPPEELQETSTTPQSPEPAIRVQQQAQPVDGEKHHVHNSYIWLGGLSIVLIVFIAMFFSLFSSFVGEAAVLMGSDEAQFVFIVVTAICIGSLVLVAAIAFFFQWLAYKNLYYVIGPDEFNLYKGIFNKTRVHVPYGKIQSVDQKATLLQRIFGVRTLYIDTAGGAKNKAIIVPYLTKHDAEWLRGELFARKSGRAPASPADAPQTSTKGAQGNVLDAGQQLWDELPGVFAGESCAELAPSFEYGLSNKELALAGISNTTSFAVIVFGIVAVLSQIISGLFDIFPDDSNEISAMVTSTGSRMLESDIVAVVVMALGLLAFIWIVNVIGTCIGYGGFKAARRGSRVEVQYGLLQHTFQGVDIDRVQAVVVKQSFIRRLMGYCEITLSKVDAASQGDGSNKKQVSNGIVVHPFVKLDRAPDIIAGLVPEFDVALSDAHPVAPVALRRALIRRCIVQGTGFWLALVTLVVQLAFGTRYATDLLMLDRGISVLAFDPVVSVCTLVYVIAALITIVSAISAVLWARGSSFVYDERFTRIVNGGFTITTTTIPRRKIQFGYLKSNPLQRRARTVTLNARTAAGIGGTTVSLIDVRQEDGEAWIKWLEPRSA